MMSIYGAEFNLSERNCSPQPFEEAVCQWKFQRKLILIIFVFVHNYTKRCKHLQSKACAFDMLGCVDSLLDQLQAEKLAD